MTPARSRLPVPDDPSTEPPHNNNTPTWEYERKSHLSSYEISAASWSIERSRGLKVGAALLIQRLLKLFSPSTLTLLHNSYSTSEYNFSIFFAWKHFCALYYVINSEFDLWIFQFPSNYFVNPVTGNLPVEH